MIVKSAILPCSPERAFALFTECAGEWWPADRRHTDDASSAIQLNASGRFYERASDGTEVELGFVRAFEPARRLLLDWYPGTGRDRPTRVEVLFEPIDTRTRITIKHDDGTAGSDVFGRKELAYGRSWDRVITALAQYCAAAHIDVW